MSVILLADEGRYYSTNPMEEVVVTGTKTVQLLSESPVRVEVISAVDLQRMHAKDIAEAVQQVSGIQLKSPVGKGGVAAMMQGVSANRVLVLVDGEPVTASTGSTVDLSQIAATNVKRIEVVKGATSALYGSAAIGGVINIITQDPEQGLQVRVSGDLANYNDPNSGYDTGYPGRRRLDANGSYSNEWVSVAAGVNVRSSDGYKSGVDDWSQPGPDGNRLNAYISGTWYATENTEHKLSYAYYNQTAHSKFTEEKAGIAYRQEKHDDSQRNTYKYIGTWQGETRDIRLSATHEDYKNNSSPNKSTERQADFTYNNIATQINQSWGEWQTWTVGLDFSEHGLDQFEKKDNDQSDANESDFIKKPEVNHASRQSIEAYIQDHIQIDGLSLLPGIRWQNDSDFGSQYTPKINVRYDIKATDEQQIFLRAGVGKGYRVPDLKERHYLLDHSEVGTGYIVMGNPDLKPEYSISYQLGFGIAAPRHYQLDINIFKNDLTDLIDTRLDGKDENGIQIYRYMNFEKARTQGFEVNGMYQFNDRYRMQLGYSYLDAKDLITGLRLNNRARHQVKAQLDLTPIDDWDIMLRTSWQSGEVNYEENEEGSASPYNRLTSPAWGQVDIKLNHQLSDKFSVYSGIDNITNTMRDYSQDYDNRSKEGRVIYLGVSFQY